MILAILLGPHAAFLVMASILTVQALFFADGGLLALGATSSTWVLSLLRGLPVDLQADRGRQAD